MDLRIKAKQFLHSSIVRVCMEEDAVPDRKLYEAFDHRSTGLACGDMKFPNPAVDPLLQAILNVGED